MGAPLSPGESRRRLCSGAGGRRRGGEKSRERSVSIALCGERRFHLARERRRGSMQHLTAGGDVTEAGGCMGAVCIIAEASGCGLTRVGVAKC